VGVKYCLALSESWNVHGGTFPVPLPLASTAPPSKLPPVKVLLTAGPTREPIDPVRFLTNRSSGKMGYTLAGAFLHEGHSVLLISGPTNLDVPDGVDFIPVETAAEMHDAVERYIGKMDVAVFAAAVADYTPANILPQKIKKSGDTLTLELVRTADILSSARDKFGFTGILVGFAAETENLETNAREKLVRKQCDLVVANDVSQPGIGFDSDENQVLLIYPERTETLPRASKVELSLTLVDAIIALKKVGN
jgi:phosphopantothenoylcysteine decarboxylase/phosphopantothenate--cysteine ligase